MRVLVVALQVDTCQYRYRLKPNPTLALCLLLRRLADETRWWDIAYLFRVSETFLSLVFNDLVQHLVRLHDKRLL